MIASAEDAEHSTIVPRLLAAGADLERVSLVDVTYSDDPSNVAGTLTLPDDLDQLAAACRRVQARMLALDPLVSYLPEQVNAHRDQHVRRVLAPLAKIAADLALAVVGVVHLNKHETTDVLSRVGGSVGFTAAARSVIVFGRDPNDPDGENGCQRVLAHAKSNLAPLAPSLLARIEPRLIEGHTGPIETSRVVFGAETGETARDLLAQPASAEERTARDDAADFLRAELADGPVLTTQLRSTAEGAGLSWRTVERAKQTVRARAIKTATGWAWELNTAADLGGLADGGGLGGLGGLPSTTGDTAKNPLGGLEEVGGLEGQDRHTAKTATTTKGPTPEQLAAAFPGSQLEDGTA